MTDTRDPLRDEHLEDEIELVGDLVVAATGAGGPLSQEQIDAVLGVTPGAPEQDDDGPAQRNGDGEPEAPGAPTG